ncbi:outer membrane efflux protein [delta proteobacterium NaphS2]|nr:outer membrane efflux protein [delta proteobacterium NaphS2]
MVEYKKGHLRDTMAALNFSRRLLVLFFVIGWCLTWASCTYVEKGIDQTVGGPNPPADTTVTLVLNEKEEEPPEPPQIMPPPSGPLKITTTDAVLLSLTNNRSLVVEKLNPAITKTFEDTERAVFDPNLAAELWGGRTDGENQARSGSLTEDFIKDEGVGVISLEQFFPTGTTVTLEGATEMNNSSLYQDAFYWSRLGLTVNQAILRGYGSDVNLVRLRQARLETRMSEFELRGFTLALVAQVEETFWDYALAKRQVEIYEESLKVARRQVSETLSLIEVGRLAKSELPAVQAELAAQEQGLIDARSERETLRLQLLRLLNPAGRDLWQREVDLIYQPTLPQVILDEVRAYVDMGLRMRPLLNEARLKLMQNDLEVVKTKNGLLPLLDLFVTLGKSGYANSFSRSVSNITGEYYDAFVGLRFQYPIYNRDPRSRYERATLSREQAQKSLENLSQLVELDVRTAYVEVNRAREQIKASATTRIFSEETLLVETEKLRVGKSTSLLVAQAQRDLLISRIAEVEALAGYINALINLYTQDGSLLARRGIVAPGRKPVKISNFDAEEMTKSRS